MPPNERRADAHHSTSPTKRFSKATQPAPNNTTTVADKWYAVDLSCWDSCPVFTLPQVATASSLALYCGRETCAAALVCEGEARAA